MICPTGNVKKTLSNIIYLDGVSKTRGILEVHHGALVFRPRKASLRGHQILLIDIKEITPYEVRDKKYGIKVTTNGGSLPDGKCKTEYTYILKPYKDEIDELISLINELTAKFPVYTNPSVKMHSTEDCVNCGAEIPGTRSHCSNCGASRASKNSLCSNCGAEIPSGIIFCVRCGTRK